MKQIPGDQDAPSPEDSLIRTFRLDTTGLHRLLGSLETDILETMWRLTHSEAQEATTWTTIGAVIQALGANYHYKTVQTVMNRLVEKKLLERRQLARAHEYRPTISRVTLLTQATRSILGELLQDFGDIAVSQFVQVLQTTSPEHLQQLERLMERTSEREHTATEKEGHE